MTRIRACLFACLLLGLASCLPGSQTGFAPPSTSTPADEVFINMLRAIEEKRPEQFLAAVSSTCNPDKDDLWNKLNDFLKNADQIELVVSVQRRNKKPTEITYIFTWERRHSSRETGEVLTAKGQSEWTISRVTGRFLLEQAAGDLLF